MKELKKQPKTAPAPVTAATTTTTVAEPVRKAVIQKPSKASAEMVFGKKNYQLFIVGIVILVIGYILLGIEDFIDVKHFSIALYIAPIVIIGGYASIIYAILVREKNAD